MNYPNTIVTVALLMASTFAGIESSQAEDKIDIVVHRSPTCGCCGKWIDHLKQNNFNVTDIVTDDVQAVKNKHGVFQEMASCHTAIVGGYVVEGHVPANDIRTMLLTKPGIVGITVPGMPMGTPGMEMGGKKDAYQVLSFDKDKHSQVFSSHPAE